MQETEKDNAIDDDAFSSFLEEQVSVVRDRLDSAPLVADGGYGERTLIGEGGQKRIYSAYDSNCCRQVALALLKKDTPEGRAQFMREARITALLQHPSIMPIYAHGVNADGQPFFTMRLIAGDSLASLIPTTESAVAPSTLAVFTRVCEAVAYAHAKGVIHRDLKPDNVQLGSFGGVLLSDWGLAALDFESCDPVLLDDETLKGVDLKVSASGAIKGTPGFMAPELIDGSGTHTPASDQFALGATLHLLLTGKLPMRGNTAEEILLSTKWRNIDPFWSGSRVVSEGLQAICRKALAPSSGDRYASVAVMLEDLRQYQAGFATQAEEAGTATQLRLFFKRNQATCIAAFIGAGCIAMVTLIAFYTVLEREQVASGLVMELRIANQMQEKLKKRAAPEYLERATEAFYSDDLNSALALARVAVEYDPDSQDARDLYALTLMARQKFQDAAELTHGNNPRLNRIAAAFADRKTGARLDRAGLMAFLKALEPDDNKDLAYVYRNLMFEEFQLLTEFSDKLALMRDEMRYRNPKVKELHFEGKETNGVFEFDLSSNPNLNRIYVLEKLGPITVRRIDLSNTGVSSLAHLGLMKIDTLVVRDCREVNLSSVALSLRALDAGGAHDVSHWLKGSQIEQLWISGSDFRNYGVLTTMPKLRLLVVDKGRLPAAVRRALPKDCKVVEEGP